MTDRKSYLVSVDDFSDRQVLKIGVILLIGFVFVIAAVLFLAVKFADTIGNEMSRG